MKFLKGIAITLSLVCVLMLVGCGESNFSPDSFEMEYRTSQSKTEVKASSDEKLVNKVWKLCTGVSIDEAAEGEMGNEYIYVAFFNKNTEDYAVFTLYSNGACCLGEEFDVFYQLRDGEKIYKELLEIYNECPKKQ